MDPLATARRAAGLGLTVGETALKLALHGPRIAIGLLGRHIPGSPETQDREGPVVAPAASAGPTGRAAQTGPAEPPQARPAPERPRGRATAVGDVEITERPAEPTSAAGASGGIAGTAAAPGTAARAGAPDPTAVTALEEHPIAPRGARRFVDVQPTPNAVRHPPEIRHTDADAHRLGERLAEQNAEEEAVLSLGDGEPHAQLHVEAPWPGYEKMKARDIVDRINGADPALKGIVLLYEQTHKKRKTVLEAAAH